MSQWVQWHGAENKSFRSINDWMKCLCITLKQQHFMSLFFIYFFISIDKMFKKAIKNIREHVLFTSAYVTFQSRWNKKRLKSSACRPIGYYSTHRYQLCMSYSFFMRFKVKKKLWNDLHCRAPANYMLTVVGPARINMLPACSRSTSRLLSGEEELHFHCLHYPSYERLIVGHHLLSFSTPTASEWVHSMGVENNRWGTVGNIVCKTLWGMVFIKKPHMHIPLYGINWDTKRKICDSEW